MICLFFQPCQQCIYPFDVFVDGVRTEFFALAGDEILVDHCLGDRFCSDRAANCSKSLHKHAGLILCGGSESFDIVSGEKFRACSVPRDADGGQEHVRVELLVLDL